MNNTRDLWLSGWIELAIVIYVSPREIQKVVLPKASPYQAITAFDFSNHYWLRFVVASNTTLPGLRCSLTLQVDISWNFLKILKTKLHPRVEGP